MCGMWCLKLRFAYMKEKSALCGAIVDTGFKSWTNEFSASNRNLGFFTRTYLWATLRGAPTKQYFEPITNWWERKEFRVESHPFKILRKRKGLIRRAKNWGFFTVSDAWKENRRLIESGLPSSSDHSFFRQETRGGELGGEGWKWPTQNKLHSQDFQASLKIEDKGVLSS